MLPDGCATLPLCPPPQVHLHYCALHICPTTGNRCRRICRLLAPSHLSAVLTVMSYSTAAQASPAVGKPKAHI